jgi:selenocysteine lyase/cysteine desulfurase
MPSPLDVDTVRAQFPALHHIVHGKPAVFLDNPGGTQVPRTVIQAMTDYLTQHNANHGGAFATSESSDAILQQAHQAMADMVNASSADEIVFGPNMTTLTLGVSRALAQKSDRAMRSWLRVWTTMPMCRRGY